VCIFADVPEECNEAVTAQWSQIANVLFPHFLEPTSACGLLGLCVRYSGPNMYYGGSQSLINLGVEL